MWLRQFRKLCGGALRSDTHCCQPWRYKYDAAWWNLFSLFFSWVGWVLAGGFLFLVRTVLHRELLCPWITQKTCLEVTLNLACPCAGHSLLSFRCVNVFQYWFELNDCMVFFPVRPGFLLKVQLELRSCAPILSEMGQQSRTTGGGEFSHP